jgi:hypothetical protein
MALRAPFEAGNPSMSPSRRRIETSVCVIVGILVGWFYVWSAIQPGNSWTISSRDPQGYYGLETAGFRSGHLYAAITPHPALLALRDPYDPVANAPYRVHDMSLYKGHYYLYFGVTPALILFWPVAAVSGQYLSEPFAVAVFCSAAIWVGMGLLLAIRRRYYPKAPSVALFTGWVCLAWATPLTLLVEGPQFYQVPISCAIYLQALMLAAIYRAVISPKRGMAWMSAAGLLFGLSMGARPNYLAEFIVLLVPIFFLARQSRDASGSGRGTLAKAGFATFLPALFCGLGLLYYNWARFGSVAEFGMHYQLAGERFTKLKTMSPGFLVSHVWFYLFNPGHWRSYFPFFSADAGQPYGFLRYIPWAWLAAAAFLRPRCEDLRERSAYTVVVVSLACAFLINLAVLSCFFGTTARYPGDFANAALILAGVGALALGQRAADSGRPRVLGTGLIAAAAISLFFALTVYIGWFPAKDAFLGLARAANWPEYAWQRARGEKFGGLRLELILPERPPALAEPLIETGMQSDQRDWLEIQYLPKGRAQLSLFHAGTGRFPSSEFQVPADHRIVIDARFGSLLPPFSHPVFSDWTREQFDDVKRDVHISVDGKEVLRASIDCYESSPSNMRLGRLAWFSGGMQQSFTGSIVSVERLPLLKPEKVAPVVTKAEPVELSLILPTANQSGADPLFLTGHGKESDLLYCIYDGANHIKFALDHFGNGGPQSEWVPYDPLVAHTVLVWMGSMAGAGGGGASGRAARDRLVVVFDGRSLLNDEQVFYPSSPESAIVGFNAYGSTGAGREFSGRIVSVRQVSEDLLPTVSRNGSYGAVEMSVVFPYGLAGTQEPLVVTGVSGAGDFVYVRYVDPSHIILGFDHWGIGGIVGEPIDVDYGQTHRLAITFQSLYPPDSPSHQSNQVRVLMDGKVVLTGKYNCHPSSADQIKVGANRIGGSTCGPVFSGRILSVERFAQPRQ